MTILARFNGEPALLAPGSEDLFKALCVGAEGFLARVETESRPALAGDSFWYDEDDWRSDYRPYQVDGGVLTIPVNGVMLKGFPWATSWATGYEYISEALKRGMDDEDVKAVRFLIDSPGGMVAGNFDLSDQIFSFRGRKPMVAHAAESAYSAAYSIATAADRVLVTRSGRVGSVGVVTTHIDMGKMLEDAGVKVTFIHYGKHKVEGNPYEPLSADAKKKIQARIDALGEEFVAIVARNRGLSAKAVKATEADTFTAQEAVANGFADEVAKVDDGMAALKANNTATSDDEEDDTMAVNDQAPKTIYTQEQQDTAVAAARAEGVAEGAKTGAVAERARVQAILNGEAAKARPKLATYFAFKTDKPAAEALADLAELPEEKVAAVADTAAGAKGDQFDKAMAHEGKSGIGAGSGGDAPKKGSAAVIPLARTIGLVGFAAASEKKE